MAVDPLIELRDVNKYYGKSSVLRDGGLTVGRGELVVVVGPSGAGEPTPCGVINGLEGIGPGTVAPDGRPLPEEDRELARLRAEVGTVSRSFSLFVHKTAPQDLPSARTGGRGRRAGDGGRCSRQLAHDGTTLAVAIHGRGLARPAGGRVVFRADGRIVEDRTSGQFRTAPRGDRAEGFRSGIIER
ncbi:hypothetical protein OK074_6275 [Actinobacteria bacterium OK074]|nr:hypothetical protein OK074_6275 [Actinobacteria bacterium OK074]